MAVYSNEVLIGTDGWYEYGPLVAMSEVMDIALGGWVDHEETDDTAGAVIPGVYFSPKNEMMFFHMHDRRRK